MSESESLLKISLISMVATIPSAVITGIIFKDPSIGAVFCLGMFFLAGLLGMIATLFEN